MNVRDQSLAGRTAIITGGGSGIGRATALALAQRGCNVVVSVRRGFTGEETAQLVEAEGGQCRSIEADCADLAAMEATVKLAVDSFGGLDIMLHNAVYGHGAGITPVEEIGDDHLDKMLEVTMAGAYNCAVTALPYLKKSDCARFLAQTSDFGLYATRLDPCYALIKTGTRGFIKALAREWGPYGITVNALSPAALSEGADDYFAQNPGMKEAFYRKFPLGQIGRPREDIGDAIAGLCKPEFRYLTAQTIVLDGGLYTGL